LTSALGVEADVRGNLVVGISECAVFTEVRSKMVWASAAVGPTLYLGKPLVIEAATYHCCRGLHDSFGRLKLKVGMHDVLYLHGFGHTNPRCCPVARALRAAVPGIRLHSPCYHPEGRVAATQIGRSLEAFTAIIEQSTTGKAHLVGYSFGGLLAAILAMSRPRIVAKVLLLAPAIDNFARNYDGRDPATWRMPRKYVEELRAYPARPEIVCPTTLVHGLLDVDSEGSAPWRVREWAAEQSFRSVYFLDGIDHSLEPWLSAPSSTNDGSGNIPPFQYVINDLKLAE